MAERVAIVRAGSAVGRSAEAGDYDSVINHLKGEFERQKRDEKPLIECSVVATTEEALKWVGRRGTIFYMTIDMKQDAERVDREHPGIRVVVLTGGPIEGVFYLRKGWPLKGVCVAIALGH